MNKPKQKRSIRWIILLGVAAITGIFALWLLTPQLQLQFVDNSNGKIILRFSVDTSEEFTIFYIHSVQKTPVFEHFGVLSEGQIELRWMEFQTQGSGLPDPPLVQGDFSIKNNWMRLSDIGTIYSSIPLRVGSVAGHKLIRDGKTYNLLDYVTPGTLLVIKTEKRTQLSYLLNSEKGGLNHD